MRKYYNSKTRHRFRRIVRFIDRKGTVTLRSKRELKKKFRSFLKHVKNSFASLQLSMKFGGGFWNTQRMKLPLVRTFYRHNYDRQRKKTTSDRGMKNTLPQYIDYALSTDYIDKERVRKNMRELMQLRNMLKLHPVLYIEKYDMYSSRITNLLTNDHVVMT